MAKKVICDCDNTLGVPGRPVDDGQTILYLLGRADIDLIGITTNFGNGPIEEVYPATVRLLHNLGRDDIPIFQGAGRRGQAPTEAARFLAEQAAASPGQISVLAIGSLGNLHAAALLDPDVFENLAEIVIMGGYLHPLPIPGWENVPELNLSRDPEASYAVLNAPCAITLMNAHICLDTPYGLRELTQLTAWQNSSIYRDLANWFQECEVRHGAAEDYLWDLLPAVYLSYPDLFEERQVRIHSSLKDLESGMLVLDGEHSGAEINMPARILDVERFYAILNDAWMQVTPHR